MAQAFPYETLTKIDSYRLQNIKHFTDVSFSIQQQIKAEVTSWVFINYLMDIIHHAHGRTTSASVCGDGGSIVTG